MDFRVYYYGVTGFFDGTRPMYGEASGMGWPMHYRYPPLFMLLFRPLTVLPIGAAAAVWISAKLGLLALLLAALVRRLPSGPRVAGWLVPLLFAGPYVVEDLRYGNAQTFIFLLTAGALLMSPRRVFMAAAALALAICIKVWPLFFVPVLAARREWRTAAWTLVLAGAFTLAPSLYFGLEGNGNLLAEWTRQEFATQSASSEIWFPSQSLRSVMMRYLTFIDYSKVPDSNYPLIHVALVDPAIVRVLWILLGGAAYAGLLEMFRRNLGPPLLKEGLAFSLLILLEPFSQKYTLVVLLWPAVAAARYAGRGRWNSLLYAAAMIAIAQPLVPGAQAQRWMQVVGFDFLATSLIAAFIAVSILYGYKKEMLVVGIEPTTP